jgi:hypothetical protein|eukprot:4845731-Prymnesium_polylepis.1
MSQQDHTHWWRDGDASAASSSLQIGHHQAVVSPVRDECCAGAAGRSPRRTDSKEQRHEPAAWMSRRLVSTAVLTSGMTASDRERELRYLASSQRESWPLLRDMAFPTPTCAKKVATICDQSSEVSPPTSSEPTASTRLAVDPSSSRSFETHPPHSLVRVRVALPRMQHTNMTELHDV